MFQRHVWRYLNTTDGKSMSNFRRHAKKCWGEEAVEGADNVKVLVSTRNIVEKALVMPDRSITATFERINKGKGNVTYSH
jgi:hypothetical protein